LKTRTQNQAEQSGHPELWTSDNVEAARLVGNATIRPRRLKGLTPDDAWRQRGRLTVEYRDKFQATVESYRPGARCEMGLPLHQDLTRVEQAKVDRKAITRALVAHDLLLFTRRRIPAPIPKPKVTSER
jgi:hypothetical protein